MRVAFLTNLTARDSLPVLQKLIGNKRIELIQVIFYDTVGEARQSPLKILKEFGLGRVASKASQIVLSKCRRILFQGPLRSLIRPITSFELVVSRKLPHTIVSDLNASHSQQQLRGWNLDVLLVCICKNILNKTTLDIPRLAAVNIHPSLLPKYRGPRPVFWMLYYGETQAGVTFQRMTPQIDDGPIVAQISAPLDLNRSEDAISRDLFVLAAEKLDFVLELISKGQLQAPASNTTGSYFSYPTRENQSELKLKQRQRKC
jgi:hypothetical protein